MRLTESNGRHGERGYVLMLALAFMGIMLITLSSLVGYTTLDARAQRQTVAASQALALAEAGIDKAVYELNQNGTYTGETNSSVPGGTFVTSVASINSSTKRITSTGYIPDMTNPTSVRTVQVTVSINTSVVSFQFGVQVGNGGLLMDNNSTVHGNVYSNGTISGSGTITGSATVTLGTSDTPDQSSEIQNNSFNLGDTSARANVAMGFRPSVSALLARTTVYLKKIGAPGDITIKVVTDNNGKPSKTVLATGTISASIVGSSYEYVDVTYSSTATLTANQQYWLIAIASVDASNYFIWGDDTSNGYSGGSGKYSQNWNASNPSWSNVGADMAFRTYMEGAPTSISGVTVQGDAWAHTLNGGCVVGGNAFYQSISGCSVNGTSYPGSADATPVPLPISDAQIADWEALASAGGTIPGPYSISGTATTIGPKKIDGDLTITNGGHINLTGPVWVNGNVIFSNNAILSVDASAGAAGAIIVADAPGNTSTKGTVSISNNVIISGNGNTGSYPMIVTTNTGSQAIDLQNNGASVILYAPYGTVDVSNNASGNQITARYLHLNNNASINYVSGLQSTSFTNGPGGSWTYVPGTYAITQ